MARGVGYGAATRVRAVCDARRGQPAGALPQVRYTSADGVQMAGPLAGQSGGCGPIAASAFEPAANGGRDRAADCCAPRCPSGLGSPQDLPCLKREDISPPAVSTVHQILRRSDRIKAPLGGAVASQRFEMSEPNQLWQMDFKGWIRLGNEAQCHPLTVVDDHSRYDLCLQACADQRGDTVRDRLEVTFRHYGLPDCFFVDNGTPWGDPSGE